MKKTSLKNLFQKYKRIKDTDEDVPNGFWTSVSEYWSKLEGEEHLSNNSVRKRFNRRLSKDYNEVLGEFDAIDDEIYTQENESTISNMDHDGDYDKEYKTKQDFEGMAKEEGVEDAYQQFLKDNNIDQKDVVNVYFKQKASGMFFTVQTRFNREEDNFDPVEEIKDVFSDYKAEPYKVSDYVASELKDRIAVIALFDCHIDKISWLLDTDEENTLDDNIKRVRKTFIELVEFVKTKKPEKIVLPIGNDFFHTNDSRLTTKNGTDMRDSLSINPKLTFRIGVLVIRELIDMLYSITENLEIVSVRGNHDYDRVFYFTEVLKMAYENHEGISFIDNERSRNYIRYGEWLFGFAHGDNERQPNQLQQRMTVDVESKKHWSEISRAIWFLGDIHHEKRFLSIQSEDFQGCEIKYLRAMSGTDSWHWQKGYRGIPKTGYAFVFDSDAIREYEHKVSFK